jgi:hypothetical protein
MGNSETEIRHVFCIVFILSLIPVSAFPWLVRKCTVLDLDLQIQKTNFLCFFHQYGQISCVSKMFLEESALRDNTKILV